MGDGKGVEKERRRGRVVWEMWSGRAVGFWEGDEVWMLFRRVERGPLVWRVLVLLVFVLVGLMDGVSSVGD